MEPEPPGAAFFGWSRSRLRDLGLLEPEPPKKVAAPQHCLLFSINQCFGRPYMYIQYLCDYTEGRVEWPARARYCWA